MARSPAVRVSAALDMFELLETYEPGSRARVWARVPEPTRELIDSLWRTQWIPLEHDHHLPEAIVAEFGIEKSRELFRRAVPSIVEKPMLEPLVFGMLRVLGTRRARLLTILPKGWGLVFRVSRRRNRGDLRLDCTRGPRVPDLPRYVGRHLSRIARPGMPGWRTGFRTGAGRLSDRRAVQLVGGGGRAGLDPIRRGRPNSTSTGLGRTPGRGMPRPACPHMRSAGSGRESRAHGSRTAWSWRRSCW